MMRVLNFVIDVCGIFLGLFIGALVYNWVKTVLDWPEILILLVISVVILYAVRDRWR
jgi:hypothetical protein